MRWRAAWGVVVGCVLAVACQTTSPVKGVPSREAPDAGRADTAADAAVPTAPAPACPDDLTGVWVHGASAAHRYELADDGGTVQLRRVWQRPDAGFRRVFFGLDAGADAGLIGFRDEPLDAGPPPAPVDTELRREPDGLRGHTHGVAPSPLGQSCVVDFGVRVVSCRDGGLVVETERIAVGPHCERLDGGAWLRHVLVRSPTAL